MNWMLIVAILIALWCLLAIVFELARIRLTLKELTGSLAQTPLRTYDELSELSSHIQSTLEDLERKRQLIIDKGAADGKTISTEAALKSVMKLRETYDGPDREHYIGELDQFIDEFRRKHGPQIPVDQAYAILKDIEVRLGQVE